MIMRFRFETVLKMFTEISERYNVQGNSMRMKMTYSSVMKNIMELQSLGLMEIKKVGRENRIRFTERGRKLVILFKQIEDILKQREGNGCSGKKRKEK
jgi:predicted transcriptional regulator